MTVRRPRRRAGEVSGRKPPAERRKQVLAAAREVIEEQGLAMLTMERIALRAGVSKPVAYSQFPNRSAVLVALLEEFWDDLDGRLKSEVRDSPEAFVRQVTDTYFDALARGGRALQEVLSSGAEEPEVDSARRERSRRIDKLWGTHYERAFGLAPHTAEAAAAVIRSAIAGAGALWMDNPGMRREDCTGVCLLILAGAFKELGRSHD